MRTPPKEGGGVANHYHNKGKGVCEKSEKQHIKRKSHFSYEQRLIPIACCSTPDRRFARPGLATRKRLSGPWTPKTERTTSPFPLPSIPVFLYACDSARAVLTIICDREQHGSRAAAPAPGRTFFFRSPPSRWSGHTRRGRCDEELHHHTTSSSTPSSSLPVAPPHSSAAASPAAPVCGSTKRGAAEAAATAGQGRVALATMPAVSSAAVEEEGG